jgi:hypothetical protein
MAKLTKSTNPLTANYNSLLEQWKQYNLSNPDNQLDFPSYRMINSVSPNFSIGANATAETKPFDMSIPKITDNQTINVPAQANENANVKPLDSTLDVSSIISDIYSKDKDVVEANKKFLIGSSIGKSLLNVSNLANAFAKRPSFIGAGTIPNVEYPNITGGMTADMNKALGNYRSGISRYTAERGLSPDVRIGAEGETLAKELEQRAKISALANENKIAETTANAVINEANIKNRYESEIADATRMADINEKRSALVQQGLTNIGKIGGELGTGLLGQKVEMNKLDALNKYMALYQDAVKTQNYQGGFYDYLKTLGIDINPSQYVGVNTPLTTEQMGEKTVKQ